MCGSPASWPPCPPATRPRWSAPTGACPRCPSLRPARREVMAPASDDSTGRGSQPFPFPRSTQEGPPIMTNHPSRVTPAEISDLLDQARQLTPGADLTDLIAYHEQKALLLSRIAADLGTTEAHEVAADAWHLWAACVAAPTLRAQ